MIAAQLRSTRLWLGPLVWIVGSTQCVAVEIIAGLASHGYSVRYDTLSDLGNTACGLFVSRFVCSPLHILTNISFVVFGVAMAVGSWLIYQATVRNRVSALIFTALGAAGVASVFVGLFPENIAGSIHVVGAGTALVL